MPLHYEICEELNLVLYIGEGLISSSDFYSAESRLLAEKRLKPGRITLVDMLNVSITFSWDDINAFLDYLKSMAQYEAGPYILLTLDQGLHLLAKATNLITSKAELQIYVYHNIEDAISAFGWTAHKHEILQFWHESKTKL